jgi:hypothetical protein
MENLVCFGVAVLFFGAPSITAVALKWLENRKEVQLRQLEVAALEAQARLVEAQARAALPEFVDGRDAAALDAWRKARQEVGGREL